MLVETSGGSRPTAELRSYLRPGEELTWIGGPSAAAWFTSADLFFVPFTVLWLAFACFWELAVVASGGPLLFKLWGIPFVAVGSYMAVGRFFVKRYRSARTAYGVTSDRAMIVTRGSFRDLQLRGAPMTVRRTRAGRASVTLGTVDPGSGYSFLGRSRRRQYAQYANTGMEPLMRSAVWPFAFYDVDNPDAMLAAIDRARAGSSW